MYTQQDMNQITKRIKVNSIVTLLVVALLVAGDVVGLKKRWEVWVMIDGPLIFAVICFAWCLFLYPCIRYRSFLKDMNNGLGREMAGTVVEIAEAEEMQDGVRVLPVRIRLEDEDDERIVYLNAAKRDALPEAGARVRLNCFGRHIKEVLA